MSKSVSKKTLANDHAFAKKARKEGEAARNDLRTDAFEAGARLGYPKGGYKQPNGDANYLVQNDGGRGNFVNGLAEMSTADQRDQYFDNIHWYSDVYSKIPGVGQEVGARGLALGQVTLGPEYFDYLQRRKETEFGKTYELWKLSQVDLESPANRDWWQAKFPELYHKKMLYYNNRSRLAAKAYEIQARGPHTLEDFQFLYLQNLGIFETSSPEDINAYVENPVNSLIWQKAMNAAGQFDWAAATAFPNAPPYRTTTGAAVNPHGSYIKGTQF